MSIDEMQVQQKQQLSFKHEGIKKGLDSSDDKLSEQLKLHSQSSSINKSNVDTIGQSGCCMTPKGTKTSQSSSKMFKDQSDGSFKTSETPSESHGHNFVKKTFHRPAYCHHCTEVMLGILRTGYYCEVCNFMVHERCLPHVISFCSTIAASMVTKPVSHCWSEKNYFKRKFCNVCRKRLEESLAVRCEICEYHTHVDCKDYVINDCKETAAYTPFLNVSTIKQCHHWREGNLPSNSKCEICRKVCWSNECLTGFRCEWCGSTCHAGCLKSVPTDCNFGELKEILLPPAAVCLPRTKVLMEHIIGVPRSSNSRFTPGSWSSDEESKEDSFVEKKSPKEQTEKEPSDEYVKVFDGNSSLKRKSYRCFNFNKSMSSQNAVEQCLKSFYLPGKSDDYYMLEINEKDGSQRPISDITTFKSQLKFDNKRPAIMLRHKESKEQATEQIKIYPGEIISYVNISSSHYKEIPITKDTATREILITALRKFNCEKLDHTKFYLVEVCMDKSVTERELASDEHPWDIIQRLKQDSVRTMRLTRFYIKASEDPHGPNVSIFVGNLLENLDEKTYERMLIEKLGHQNKWDKMDVIYYENGCLILSYSCGEKAEAAYEILKDTVLMDRQIMVMLLPRIIPSMIPDDITPLLVFVNIKSGGGQGSHLITSFRKLLNPHQVFNLDFGGPLPGLYCFRSLKSYKILVCGGDGTVGWALSCLDNTSQDAACDSPPIAVLPVGTGNDLARVLNWGGGYTTEDPYNILKDVVAAEDVKLDRWTLVVRSDDGEKDEAKLALQLETNMCNTNEDNSILIIMNNYFGIGIDADLALDFHNARSENPEKFNSRMHNKSVYLKMGLRKMMYRTSCKDLHKQIIVEADGKILDLPPLEGLIVLNIMSWAGGANPWVTERDDRFNKPTHYDGMLEVVGVSGVVHMGQIHSGLRSGIRVGQASHLKITLKNDLPVQVDGEPFIQSPGQIVVLKSALKATMLKKCKKVKRRNTEPSVIGPVSNSN